MTILKKSKAIIAAILVAITMFTCAMPAYAQTKSTTLYIGLYKATCKLNSPSKYIAIATTDSTTKYWDYISASVTCAIVDKNGDNARYKVDLKIDTNSRNPGEATLSLDSSGTDYFKNIVSAHTIKSGSTEKGDTLDIHY